jgi:hypothetical protein
MKFTFIYDGFDIVLYAKSPVAAVRLLEGIFEEKPRAWMDYTDIEFEEV